jgi:hypothetical protein
MISFAPVNYSSATDCPQIITRQAMHVKVKIEVRWCNHCGEAISTTYNKSVFVALTASVV